MGGNKALPSRTTPLSPIAAPWRRPIAPRHRMPRHCHRHDERRGLACTASPSRRLGGTDTRSPSRSRRRQSEAPEIHPAGRHRAARPGLHPRPRHAQPRLHGLRHALRRGRRTAPPPEMAAGHVIEDDGKTWKITLRDGPALPRRVENPRPRRRRLAQPLGQARRLRHLRPWTDVDELSAISDTTIQFRLKRPFRLLPDLLGSPIPSRPSSCRSVSRSPRPASRSPRSSAAAPINSSMPERIPGSLAVYLRNADYVPRTDGSIASSGTPSPPATAAAAYKPARRLVEQATSDLCRSFAATTSKSR